MKRAPRYHQHPKFYHAPFSLLHSFGNENIFAKNKKFGQIKIFAENPIFCGFAKNLSAEICVPSFEYAVHFRV